MSYVPLLCRNDCCSSDRHLRCCCFWRFPIILALQANYENPFYFFNIITVSKICWVGRTGRGGACCCFFRLSVSLVIGFPAAVPWQPRHLRPCRPTSRYTFLMWYYLRHASFVHGTIFNQYHNIRWSYRHRCFCFA